ncbi:MAG: PKD domain-containing protein, partial [Calditrichota bacterium]
MKKSLWYLVQVAFIAIGLVACNQLDQITNDTGDGGSQTQNTAPTAAAGSDQSVSIGDTVTVDGSGSTDADGGTLTYQWTLQSKPSGSAASLHDANKAKAWFVADVGGTYTLQLKVSDGTDNATDDVTVTAEVQTIGSIDQNTTLHNIFDDPTQADYVVTDVANVNAVLTIEPGVTVEFGAGARMDVESGGTLIAVGTETDSIIFTGANKTAGAWDG